MYVDDRGWRSPRREIDVFEEDQNKWNGCCNQNVAESLDLKGYMLGQYQ